MKKAYMDGYIAGEPEERGTQNGYMLSFGFNSPAYHRKQDGTWESEAEYFDLKYFYREPHDATAEAIKAKDGRMMVEATPHQERWEKDGKTRSKVTFTVEKLWMKPADKPMEAPQAAPEDIPF